MPQCLRAKLAIIAGNKAKIARNSEEIPMELATFPAKTLLKPPNHLKAAGRRLWADIVNQYRIADGAGLALVTTAAEALDRIPGGAGRHPQARCLSCGPVWWREAERRLFP
jgi:hypothetical protein